MDNQPRDVPSHRPRRGTSDVALQLDPVMLANGRAYSVFAVGSAAAQPLGGNALQVVVAVDGMAAPATDTVGTTDGSGMAGTLLILAGLVAVAAGFGVARRLAAEGV